MDWNKDILHKTADNRNAWFELGRVVSQEIQYITDSIKDTFYPTHSQLKQVAVTLGITTKEVRQALNIFNSTDYATDIKLLPSEVPVINRQAMIKTAQSEWAYQDSNQEVVVHSQWKRNTVRHLFEGFGDIFRELAKDYQDIGYIKEKIRRWDNYISSPIHPDDSIEQAMKDDADKFAQMKSLWAAQPASTQEQREAKWLNERLVEGDITGIEMIIDKLKTLRQVDGNVVF